MRPVYFLFALALSSPAPLAAAPHIYVITIDKMKFGPVPINVRAGDVILWVNRDIFRHTATARNGSFNVDLAPRTQARTVVVRPGSIAFFCKYHPGMTGLLRVKP